MTAVEAPQNEAAQEPQTRDSGPRGESESGEPSELEVLATAVDKAQSRVEDLDDDAKEAALGLKKALEDFHKPALLQIVRSLKDDPRGKELLFALVDEPMVRAVLGLHGIIRADPITRAKAALESVRPYLQSHGGDVELVKIEDRVAYVRMHGSCNGCSMSAVTLRDGVEEALVNGIEEIDSVEALEDEPTAAFISLDSIGRKPQKKTLAELGWVEGPEVSEVSSDAMLRFDVSTNAGDTQSFIVTIADNRLAVFRNECVHQGLSLDGGMVDDGIIICPWHGFKFEAGSGDCVSNPGAQLQQVPTRVENDRILVQVEGARP